MAPVRSLASLPSLALVVLLMLGPLGCRVDRHQRSDGKDVDVATPFGGVSVKTDDHTVPTGLGLTPYPGAVLDTTSGDHNNSADVNFNLGSLHVGVRVASFNTPDAPDKVLRFYRKDMARYGVVLTCVHGKPAGSPTRTGEGLTCDHSGGGHISIDDDQPQGTQELLAGSRQHQHRVALDPRNGGTHFSLVALDLPASLSSGDGQQ